MERRAWVTLLIIVAAAVAVGFALAATGGRAPPSSLIVATTSTSTPATTATTIPSTTTTAGTASTLAAGTTVCDGYEDITVAGTVASARVDEASGAAASRLVPGVVWAHNDSGDDPTIYAIGPNGEDLGAVTVAGVIAFDWEDAAAGPGPQQGRNYLYLGDIGDNFGLRKGEVTIHRIPEPEPTSVSSVEPDLTFVLEGPELDYESLFIADGYLHLVSKNGDPAVVVRALLPTDDGAPGRLEEIARLDLGAEVTAADVSWDGRIIALRGYEQVWMWHRLPGQSVAETLASEPCPAPAPQERQGETLAFLENRSFVTLSEGSRPNLHLVPYTES